MKKVIINACYGGYGWSKPAIIEYLKRKGAHIKFVRSVGPINNRMDINATQEEYLLDRSLDVHISADGFLFSEYGIDREDSVAIALLEEKGSRYCSGGCSELRIEEYDDELYSYYIDEYDGSETLCKTPSIPKRRILACSSMNEVCSLLEEVGVLRREPIADTEILKEDLSPVYAAKKAAYN